MYISIKSYYFKMSTEFNASVSVSESLTNTLQSNVRELAIKCIRESAQRHGFNADEEIALLGLENVSIVRKKMVKAKKPAAEQNDLSSDKSAKVSSKKEKEKVSKNVFPLPFIKEIVNLEGKRCHGLAYNKGLFTQCLKNRLENGLFCNGCQTETNNNAFDQPNCGLVETRLTSDLYSFKDPNGRSPVSYMSFLEKLKISPNTAVEEATKLNITIPIEHFDIIKTDKKSKGRPKKNTSDVEIKAVVDLFSKLSDEKEFDIVEDDEEEEIKIVKTKLSDEEKEIKKAQLEEERNKKKVEREQKIAEEKANKEAQKAAEKAEKTAKAELKNKLAREKALESLEKVRLEREKEQEMKKVQEQAQTQEKECNNFEAPQQVKEEQKEQPKKVTVSKIQICGKIYLISSVNILYDPDSREEVGIWDPETKTIKELPDDDDDEEEEEDNYDTDDDN